MAFSIRRALIGEPIPSARAAEERLNKVRALAVFSSDALSSVAYATEEILLVLAAAGTAAALGLSIPIAVAIVALLAIVASSYYQTVHGYPSGGGAYIVAYDNLGRWPGLIAAAALLTDYVLTVAVSITAGVAAITSAFPELLPWRVEICLVAIALVAWLNMRGVRESGTLFAVPTYAFVAIFFTLLGVGFFRLMTGNLPPGEVGGASSPATALGSVGLFLVLRAFSSGCTALTGVEAISNGTTAFKPPEARNAGLTLVAMAVLLGTLFLGATILSHQLAVLPSEEQTVVSQMGRIVFGPGALYLFLQVATALILVLAANTSFAGFPRLAAILAHDRYLPRQLTNLGDKLVFANGILILAILASLLVILFGGRTHSLIPLYAVGVFLSFTLSQTGMVVHWRKVRGEKWQWKAAINSVGAVATGIVLVVVLSTKFIHGAWIVTIVVPAFVWLFHQIHNHYERVARQLSLEGLTPEPWAFADTLDRLKVVVPLSGVHRGTLAALRFARSLSRDVHGIVIDVEPEATARVQERWAVWGCDVPLVILPSPYRSVVTPLLAYLDEVDSRDPERGLAVVVLPEFVPAKPWETLLHNQNAQLIKRALVYRRGFNRKDRVVVDVPYHLEE
ncbi:MAG: APC family permease [Anaerolineae bacterium]|nr:APC family permease [Anaerolineae bacterium]